MDEGKFLVLVLLDLFAVFNTIDHDILLHRLQHVLGIQGTMPSWFRSYLTKRFQIASIQGTHSDQIELFCSIPQASILGPFFLFFIHNLSLILFLNLWYLKCCVLMTLMIVYLLFFFVEKCLSDVKIWMMSNKFQMNEDKTEVLCVTA